MEMYNRRPMLAATITSLDEIPRWPVFVSNKFDGFRVLLSNDEVYLRSGRTLDNKIIRKEILAWNQEFRKANEIPPWLVFDCELLSLDSNLNIDQFSVLSGKLRSQKPTLWTLMVFDMIELLPDVPSRSYTLRYALLMSLFRFDFTFKPGGGSLVFQKKCHSTNDVVQHIATLSGASNYEGIMLRTEDSTGYLNKRSTVRSGHLLKYKEWFFGTALIESVLEGKIYLDANKNAFGLPKYSTAAENREDSGTAGALLCWPVKMEGIAKDAVFSVGTGMTAAERSAWITHSPAGRQVFVRYRISSYGIPIHASFKGFVDAH